jgi:ribosomal protein S12 methylthiotransferase
MLYTYPKPEYFIEGLLKLMAQEEKICPYLDLPVQHIDDEILKRMGRRSRSRDIYSLLERVRTAIPEVSLRTSLIVGFPGETERHFKTLLDFVEKVQFDHLGAFKYSAEEGTPACRLTGSIPESVKEERLGILMNLQKRISLKKYRTMVGRSVEVLVEEHDHRKKLLRGRLKTQAPEIDGSVFLKGKGKPGDWVDARITKALPYDLIGQIERILPD